MKTSTSSCQSCTKDVYDNEKKKLRLQIIILLSDCQTGRCYNLVTYHQHEVAFAVFFVLFHGNEGPLAPAGNHHVFTLIDQFSHFPNQLNLVTFLWDASDHFIGTGDKGTFDGDSFHQYSRDFCLSFMSFVPHCWTVAWL